MRGDLQRLGVRTRVPYAVSGDANRDPLPQRLVPRHQWYVEYRVYRPFFRPQTDPEIERQRAYFAFQPKGPCNRRVTDAISRICARPPLRGQKKIWVLRCQNGETL